MGTMVTHMTLHGNAFTTGCPPCAWSNMAALESITLYSYGTSHDCGPRPDNCTIRNGTSSGVQSKSGLTDALIAMQIFALTVVIALVVRIILSRVFHERRQKDGSTSAQRAAPRSHARRLRHYLHQVRLRCSRCAQPVPLLSPNVAPDDK